MLEGYHRSRLRASREHLDDVEQALSEIRTDLPPSGVRSCIESATERVAEAREWIEHAVREDDYNREADDAGR